MKTNTVTTPIWTTASFGNDADTSPVELSALGAHLNACQQPNARLLALQCAAQAFHGFVTTRFVTTLVVALALVTGVVYLMP
ncbi:hypothetical protein [Rhodoferax sp.]|uniref:hypothetical protein n=1 Tax=Rhodoferax sp. TaxID=50421 RepID=UPI002773F0E7|nr:hypothetical protein [Rhodoferax sp.]